MECLISPMISSTIPAHSHIIPITVFSIKNHNGDARIHIIARIKFPVLLIIIPPVFKKQPPLRPVISFCPFDYITPIPCLPQKYGAKQPLCHTLFIVLTTFQSSVSALSNHSFQLRPHSPPAIRLCLLIFPSDNQFPKLPECIAAVPDHIYLKCSDMDYTHVFLQFCSPFILFTFYNRHNLIHLPREFD